MVVRSDREHNERGSRLKARTSEPPSETGQCPSTGLIRADKKEPFFNRGLTSSLFLNIAEHDDSMEGPFFLSLAVSKAIYQLSTTMSFGRDKCCNAI